MIFKDIYLSPSCERYPANIRGQFDIKSRHVCNFLDRRLKSKKITVKDFKRIVFEFYEDSLPEQVFNTSHVLVVPVLFKWQIYNVLHGSDLSEFYCKLIEAGLEKIEPSYGVPKKEIKEWIQEFRAGGYENSWIQKKIRDRNTGNTFELLCDLTQEKFSLKLVERNGESILRQIQVLETRPDEYCFESKVKDLKIKNGRIEILDFLKEPIFGFDLKQRTIVDTLGTHIV